MSRTILLRGRFNLIDYAAEYIMTGSSDLSDQLIVFPGKRPAHFLRKAVARQIRSSFIPPKIFSMDVFIDYLLSEKLGMALRPVDGIEAVGLLYEWYAEKIGGLLPGAGRHVEDVVPLGLKLMDELEELRINGVSLKKFAAAVADLPLKETHVLKEIYADFYERLVDRGLSTRASRYKTVADNAAILPLTDFRRVVLAGFFGPTVSEKMLFRELATHDSVTFVFQDGPGMEDHLKSLKLKPERISGETISPAVKYFKAGDTHSEVFGLNAILAEMTDRGIPPDDTTAIVLSKPESLFPVIRQTALAHLDPASDYNIALGYPVTRTPIYGFFQSLFDLLISRYNGQWHVPDYIKFILHPYTKNIRLGTRAGVTRILFHSIEELLVDETGRAFISLDELSSRPALRELVSLRLKGIDDQRLTTEDVFRHLDEIHTALLRPFDVNTVAQFASACTGVLSYVAKRSTANQHPLFEPFCETFLEAMEALRQSGIEGLSCRDLEGHWNLLKHHLASVTIPFRGTPLRGIQVLDMLETRNLSFERVVVLDANDDVLPGRPRPGSFVPTRLREALGMPTYHERETTSRYYFETLVAQAKEVYIFFVEEGRLERSRFVQRLLWEQEKRSIQPDIRHLQHAVRLNNPMPEAIDKTPAVAAFLRPWTFSATALDAYLRCPIRFYYSYVLRLREREEIETEIESYRIGQFVHGVLHAYFTPMLGDVLTEAALDLRRMDALVEQQFAAEFGEENTAGRLIMKKRIRQRLSQFLTEYQLPLIRREPVRILELEARYRGARNGYELAGNIDRVEERNGKIALMDYKTGVNSSKIGINFKKLDPDDRLTWSKSIKSIQLPFYQLLYSTIHPDASDDIRPMYVILGRQKMEEIPEAELYKNTNDRQRFPDLERIIFNLLDEITDPLKPFKPTEDPSKECPDCAYRFLCGTSWARSWKEA